MSAPLSTDNNVESGELSKDDILDDLMKDDEDSPDTEDGEEREEVVKDKVSKNEDGKDKDEEDEEELELKEEEEVIDDIKGPPRKKEIEKVFPGFFKKFPDVEREYYKAQQFTELIGTVEDAKELVGKAEILDAFETDLSEGNTEKILKQVKDNSPEAFEKVVTSYMESLAKVDKDAYFGVVEGVLKRGILAALNHGKALNNEELEKGAIEFYKYMFPQDTEIRMPESKKTNTEDTKLKEEREAFARERFEAAQNDLQGRIDNAVKSTIDSYIDPKDQMTPYVKKNAVKDAMDSLEDSIAKDSAFKKTVLDPLWKKAHDEKYSRTSLDKIRSAYLSKARTLLRPIIQKSRTEALKGLGIKREEKDRKGPISVNRTSTSSTERGKIKAPEKGMKTLDFLNSD